jgi:site-specific recombinase XerD
VVGLPGFGPCGVLACERSRLSSTPYCNAHSARLRQAARRDPHLDVEHWRRTQAPLVFHNRVSLRGLPDRVVAEILYGLQQRVADEVKTGPHILRPFCDLLRRRQVAMVEDLDLAVLSKLNILLCASISTHVRRRVISAETERHKDIWDCMAFGHPGRLTFGEISQRWLREAAKHWAYDDLPRRRGRAANRAVQDGINALGLLSKSLRLQRPDHGEHPSALGRVDLTTFLNRLAYLEQQGRLSRYMRIEHIGAVSRALRRMRALGLTGKGESMHGLPEAFVLSRQDMPDRPEESEAGRDLPAQVMRVLCANLDLLEEICSRDTRVLIELMIDTGRRPDEICQLPLDCLTHDGEGKPVLIYDNHKNQRDGRRLPIGRETAAVIVNQQEEVRRRYPNTPAGQLKLVPTTYRNPQGRRGASNAYLAIQHRDWLNRLPDIFVTALVSENGHQAAKEIPFDKALIVPYAYRHTYAQRHADAGVPVDVLKRLMDHRQLATTQKYYRVGEERRRVAVERVTAMQFDRHGTRIWRKASELIDTEHTRRAIGEVAVPYGVCTEPSNVAAGGHDCPVRFRCVGCGHFRTDVSYLPDLLRNRERLRSAVDADDWAKAEALPSEEEIRRIRALIGRVKTGLDSLDETARLQIQEAVSVVRRARNRVVGLGLPRVRTELPDFDLRPEHNG